MTEIPRNRLKLLREDRQLTQRELALLVGKDHTTVNKHENHLRRLTEEDVEKYAKIFKISSYAIFIDPSVLAVQALNDD